MKQFITILFILSFSVLSKAQLTGNLIVSGRPSAAVGGWSLDRKIATYIISNQGGVRNGRLNVSLKNTAGEVVGRINSLATRIISINNGNNVINTNDIFAGDAWTWSGEALSAVNKAGKLNAGAYQLCVRIDSATIPIALSAEQCRTLIIQNAQLPFLVLPADGQNLDAIKAQTAITFRWTNYSPTAQGTEIKYRIQVFEILENQQPVQALRANQPILDQEIIGTTQYIWRPQLPLNVDSATKFIWTIQTLSIDGRPMESTGNGEARSEPKQFVVVKKTAAIKPKK